jgi:uncharacterized protein (DUF433 family)
MRVNVSRRAAANTLSIKEAAVLAGVTEKVIRHGLAARVIRPVRRAQRHVTLPPATVLYLALVTRLPVELGRADRRDLFELLSRDVAECGRWTRTKDLLVLGGGVPIIVPLGETTRESAARLRLFERGRKRVVSRPDVLGGEPVFAGTRLSVRHVGALARKSDAPEVILEDFPALTAADVAFARIFVELGRPPGRPRRLRLERE